MAFQKTVVFYLNGLRQEVSGETIFLPLSSFLRSSRGCTGTKVVCAEGDCGACTVLRSFPDSPNQDFRAMNSCIAWVGQMHGSHVITIEGIEKDGVLSEIQEAMVCHQGGQCGYCTPGFVMALTSLFETHSEANEKRVKNFLTGNLCRCTGYEPILRAAAAIRPEKVIRISERYKNEAVSVDLARASQQPLVIETPSRTFVAPLTMEEVSQYLSEHPTARLVNSGTDLGVQSNKGKWEPERLLSLHMVKELYALSFTDEGIFVGAKVDLERLQQAIEPMFPEFAAFLHIFASPPIKNVATLVGNVANASPIADTLPFLLAMEAEVFAQGKTGKRSIPLLDFFLGYKRLALQEGEWISGIRIPPRSKNEIQRFYKSSTRRDLDISSVNAAFLVAMHGREIERVRIAYGGVGPTVLRLTKTEKFLQGKIPTRELIGAAEAMLDQEIQPISDVRGSELFRRRLARGFWRKFAYETWAVE